MVLLRAHEEETATGQRLSLITLGVRDVSRARAFCEALGWHLDGGVHETDHLAFFQTPGCILALWDRGTLAPGQRVTDCGGWAGDARLHRSLAREA
jgi:hypothetical protein